MTFLRQLLPVLLTLAAASAGAAPDTFVYFGTHSSGPGVGLSLAHFDTDTGVLSPPKFLLAAKEPSFFTVDAAGRHLYVCNSGQPGSVSAYALDPHTGQLTFMNQQPAGGGDPSFVSLDRTGRVVFVANYQGGNVAAFRLNPDGSLGERTAFAQHTGRSVNPQRQMHAFAHSILADPTNRFVLVPDLGVDKVFIYRFDAARGSLEPNDPAFAAIAPGSGPRHLRFHPNGRWVYLINEIASTIVAFRWDAARGTLAAFQTISALPADFSGTSACAEIEIHPNGKFLYGSNRGHDSLAVFAIDPGDGHLAPVEWVPSGGKTPRNFAFDPTGKWILCTNHGSNNAVVFRVDETTGRLTATGAPVPVPNPFCERFVTVQP
jgi:6-phosphogluconolactonase